MSKLLKLVPVLFIIAALVLGVAGCSGGVSEADYQALQDRLAEASAQISQLEEDITSAAPEITTEITGVAQSLYDELQEQVEALQAQYDALDDAYDAADALVTDYQDQIADLQAQVADLTAQLQEYAVSEEGPSEEGIAQALTTLINAERAETGLNTLLPGTNIAVWAEQNSIAMITAKQTLTYTTNPVAFQAAYIAAGYQSSQAVADGTMLIWKNNPQNFEDNFLDPAAVYMSVAVVASGDYYYITYMASNYS